MWPLIHRVKAGDVTDSLAHELTDTLAGPRPYIREDDPWQWSAWHKANHNVQRAFRGDIDAVLALMPDGWTWGLDCGWREDIPVLPDNWSWAIPCNTDEQRALCSAYVAKESIEMGRVDRMAGPALALLSALLEGIARDKGLTG